MVCGHCFSALLSDMPLRTIKQPTMGWNWMVRFSSDLFWKVYFIGQKIHIIIRTQNFY